jgi:uncharacterized membrane protein
MTVTREEAAKALEEVSQASERIVTLKGYNHGAPHFIIWGLVWLVANSVTQFWPAHSNWAWGAGIVIGMIASAVTGMIQSRGIKRSTPSSFDAYTAQRIGLTSLVSLTFIGCLIFISRPETSRETNAMISIFFPFMYMGSGIWAGWRLFAIGFVTAVGTMAGFVWIDEYYPLWMGLFGGGSLIAGGLWLRSA